MTKSNKCLAESLEKQDFGLSASSIIKVSPSFFIGHAVGSAEI